MSPQKLEKLSTKNSTELIVYQLGEVKNLLENMVIKVDNYQEKTDRRIIDLEKFQVSQLARNIDLPDQKIDIQKIILAAFSLISAVVTGALLLNGRGQ